VLSSRATALYKFVLPALLGVWFAGTVWAVGFAVEPGVPGIGAFRWFFAGIGAFVVGLLLWMHAGLKQVTLEGDSLVVSNFRDSVRIPLHDVARVTPSRFTNPESIRLDLVVPCSFGQRITFLPPQRWVRGVSAHPLAAELAARIESQRPGGAAPVAVLAPVRWTWIALGGVGIAAAAVALLAVVTSEIRASDAYRAALSLARGDAALVAAIGEPMDESWLPPSASWAARDGEAHARVSFRLQGPRGAPRISAVARSEDGVWRTERATAQIEGRTATLDLLAR
jgi:hypothetical protein